MKYIPCTIFVGEQSPKFKLLYNCPDFLTGILLKYCNSGQDSFADISLRGGPNHLIVRKGPGSFSKYALEIVAENPKGLDSIVEEFKINLPKEHFFTYTFNIKSGNDCKTTQREIKTSEFEKIRKLLIGRYSKYQGPEGPCFLSVNVDCSLSVLVTKDLLAVYCEKEMSLDELINKLNR
jgi:hypothetical protein